jgi:hypothetical protein
MDTWNEAMTQEEARAITGCCLAHRQLVRWQPAPLWWHHVHGYGDKTCGALWSCASPFTMGPQSQGKM